MAAPYFDYEAFDGFQIPSLYDSNDDESERDEAFYEALKIDEAFENEYPEKHFEIEKPVKLFEIMARATRLSKLTDIVTEAAHQMSGGSIPLSTYTKLAQNAPTFRSWTNYIRSMEDEESLVKTNYNTEEVAGLRQDVSKTLKLIEAANEHLDNIETTANMSDERKQAAFDATAADLSEAGQSLESLVARLLPEDRAADLVGTDHDLFKQDILGRPVRTIYSTCYKALDALAAYDSATKSKQWRALGKRLEDWGVHRIDGERAFDSYLQIGGGLVARDAEMLYDIFSLILYQLHDVLRRLPVEMRPPSPDSSPSNELTNCRFYHARILYILNQDFIFFSASERWADRMMISLFEEIPVLNEAINFVVDPVEGLESAMIKLQYATDPVVKRVLDMKADLSKWQVGYMWEASQEQVNLAKEGAKPVIKWQTVLMTSLAAEASVTSESAVSNDPEPAIEHTFEGIQAVEEKGNNT